MAVLISQADVNIDAASGFAAIETGTGASQTTRSANTNTTTSYVYSSAFTGTNLNVCDGVLVYCNRVNTTGTVSVALSEDNGTTATREVTVNASDLPADPSWVFFKFGSSLTLDGGTDYKVGIKGSSAGNATFYRDGTAGNWTRRLRLTTLATAAAADVLYIVGEHTGAGATTARTVTVNTTSATDYGTGDGTADTGIEIGDAGTLKYGSSAGTNYIMKVSGTINVWGGGTFNIGTTGTPIPRDSSAILEFDPAADGGVGLIVQNGGTFTSQGLSRTSGKDIISCKLNTDEAANSTSLGVDTDTGWLDNDIIAVASTTRTHTQSEKGTLNGAAGASSLTVDGFGGAGGGLANAHSGTSPTQAEVVLLTRNVRIRSATSTLMTFAGFKATSTVDIDWTEFRYFGENAAGKRGLEIETTTGSFNMQYSSMYDCEDQAIFITGSSTNNITISNNNLFNLVSASVSANAISIAATSGSSITFSNNIAILCQGTGGAVMFSLSDIGVTFTGNTIVGSGGAAIDLAEANVVNGTFDNNTCHSTNGTGLNMGSAMGEITVTNMTIWRSNASGSGGVSINQGIANAGKITISTLTMFGNNTQSIIFGGPVNQVTLNNLTSNGDTTFSTTHGIEIVFTPRIYTDIILNSCDFSTVSGIKTAHTNDIDIVSGGLGSSIKIIANNCKFGGTNEFNGFPANVNKGSYIRSQKHDQTSGNHKTLLKYGTITIDTTANMYRTASPSERLTPNNASNKMESGSKKVAVENGQSITISAYVRESVSGDGTDYNGNRPRLIVKRNDAIGITSDTVIDTATASAEGAFEQLTGASPTASDDGVMEFVVDCDGTTGWVNVDDWSAS